MDLLDNYVFFMRKPRGQGEMIQSGYRSEGLVCWKNVVIATGQRNR
jgi:hypothetical protein